MIAIARTAMFRISMPRLDKRSGDEAIAKHLKH